MLYLYITTTAGAAGAAPRRRGRAHQAARVGRAPHPPALLNGRGGWASVLANFAADMGTMPAGTAHAICGEGARGGAVAPHWITCVGIHVAPTGRALTGPVAVFTDAWATVDCCAAL